MKRAALLSVCLLLVLIVTFPVSAQNGIWKNDPARPNDNFYVQSYDTLDNSVVVIFSPDAVFFAAFLDTDAESGEIDADDLGGSGHHLMMTFADENNASAVLTLAGESPVSYLLTRSFEGFGKGEKGDPGPAGPQGDIGPQGPQGASPFELNGNEAYYTAGNVGIGTATPDDDLHVANHIRVGEDPTYPLLYGELKHDGGGTGFIINANANGGWADLHFQTDGTTRMFIESGGNVGIGTISPNYKLHVNGTAAGTSWTNLSSREFKEDIRKVDETAHPIMLAKLMGMDLTSYRYKEEYGGDGTRKFGFIAEEMPNEVLSKDGKGVDIYELLSFTIGAMKAQQQEIRAQQKKIAELEALNAKLAEVMRRLEILEK